MVKGPYAITDENGTYTIENVPAGAYTVTAWQEELLVRRRRKLRWLQASPAKADFTFKAK